MKTHNKLRILTLTALLMAGNIALSSFGVPVPGGHMYLNDVIICTAAILLDPFHAFMVGGVGAFIGDMLFYPTPMFVSLVTHGLQAVVISLFARKVGARLKRGSAAGLLVGAIIMVVGYSLGRAYIYSTPEYAIIKLPFQIAQAAVGAVAAWVICFGCGIVNIFEKSFGKIRERT